MTKEQKIVKLIRGLVFLNPYSYYQQHWSKMQGDGLSDVAVNVLRVLTSGEIQPMSILAISQVINGDVFDVMEVLEGWFAFLQEFREGKEVQYQLFHHSFRLWLFSKL